MSNCDVRVGRGSYRAGSCRVNWRESLCIGGPIRDFYDMFYALLFMTKREF